MSIHLTAAADARISFGDLSVLSGLTAFTLVATLEPTSTVLDDHRVAGQWGNTTAEQGFLFTTTDTNELGLVFSTGSANYFGRKTSTLDLAVGNTYRIVATMLFGSPPVITIRVNKISYSLSAFVASDNVTAMMNSTAAVQAGHETSTGTDGVEGKYSNFGIYNRVISDGEALAYCDGASPLCMPRGLILFSEMRQTGALLDAPRGIQGVNTGGTTAIHPLTTYPRKPAMNRFVAAAAFKAAWARNSNVLISPGLGI